MTKTISFAGSGEMDNGWTVSLATTFANAAASAVGVTLDMGDAGTLDYEGGTSSRGIGKIADMMPTADEDVGNGIDTQTVQLLLVDFLVLYLVELRFPLF